MGKYMKPTLPLNVSRGNAPRVVGNQSHATQEQQPPGSNDDSHKGASLFQPVGEGVNTNQNESRGLKRPNNWTEEGLDNWTEEGPNKENIKIRKYKEVSGEEEFIALKSCLDSGNKSIKLSDCCIDNGLLQDILRGCSDVKNLDIRDCLITDITCLEKLDGQLITLDISLNNFTEPLIKKGNLQVILKNNPKLTKLCMSNQTQLTGVFNSSEKYPEIKHLDIYYCNITDEQWGIIAENYPNIETLDMGGENMNVVSFEHLKKLQNLKKLRVPYNVTDDLLKVIVENGAGIERLDLTSTEITDLNPLKNMPHLKSINISDCCSIPKEQISAMKKDCPNLENFYLPV
jgi:Leucine-rich repeat (LRR) protein